MKIFYFKTMSILELMELQGKSLGQVKLTKAYATIIIP